MTEEQKNMVLAAIDAAEEYKSVTGKKIMSLSVSPEFFKTLKELVADRLDYSKHIPVDEPCEDAVSRQAVLDGVDRYIYKSQSTGTQDDFYSFAELVVKALPSVTPKQRTGHWIDKKPNLQSQFAKMYWCDQCGAHAYKSAYCPGCGAKMEGD